MEYLYDLLVNLHWGAVGQIIMIDILLGGDTPTRHPDRFCRDATGSSVP